VSITLALNPKLDPAPYARTFARDGVVRIDDVLTPSAAEAVARLLEQQTPWRLTLSKDPDELKAGLYDAARITAVGEAAVAAEVAAVNQRARNGFAYLYLSYPMLKAYLEGWDPGHPIHTLTELINSPAMLSLFRAVTGRPDVIKADAQATLYRPGDFLTLHDDGHGEGRVCAYTFGFTRTWRPDWGGQLLFHDEALEIERGLTPAFNVLTLFRTPRWHSVAPVAPYAGAPRLSIVGWARTDPKV
jgi:SM-20-related protein